MVRSWVGPFWVFCKGMKEATMGRVGGDTLGGCLLHWAEIIPRNGCTPGGGTNEGNGLN